MNQPTRLPGVEVAPPRSPSRVQVVTGRMAPADRWTNPVEARVRWSPVKSLWYSGHVLVAAGAVVWMLVEGPARGLSPLVVSSALTVVMLCAGHTVGLHRLLIHRSFACPKPVERLLVYLGVLVGMGGPFRMIYLHEVRDWAQRHPESHRFFVHCNPVWRDWLWQLHGEAELEHPPRFTVEEDVAGDPFYRWLERTWMLQQLPLAVLLFLVGGVPLAVWGTSVRIAVSLTGHWLIGYFAHNTGRRRWHLRGHAVQGYNLPYLGLLTMGECWHNNHHAFPGSARLGIGPHQADPGWWFIRALERLGIARRVRLPADAPPRPERVEIAPGGSNGPEGIHQPKGD